MVLFSATEPRGVTVHIDAAYNAAPVFALLGRQEVLPTERREK